MLEEGVVRWFDNFRGEGVIRVGEETIYVHYSAIDRSVILNKDLYYKVLFSGQIVKVTVIRDSHFTQIDSVC
jgi:cold shock CspA family protein